ncbi:glycosyltransferase [Candidatus Omnitrophota bacterium]
MEKPYISIVIPTYNSASTLGQTVESCLGQDYPKDKLEIIVVDDGSKDNTEEVVKRFPVKYIYQERRGPAAARNNGFRNSKGDGICFIDADCVPYKDWISKLVQHYDKDNVGAVAGSYAVGTSRYLLDKSVHCEIKYRHSMMPGYTTSFGTYNVLVRRSVFKELGGFNTLYYNASGEDNDLSYRIIKAGYKIYFEKDALVSHNNILRFWRYLGIQFRHSYWRMKLYKENVSMVMKDKYGYWKDFVEIFLVAASIVYVLLNLQGKFLMLGVLATVLFLIQLPFSLKVSLDKKDIRYLGFSFVTFIRAFVRVLGGIVGFIRFWVIRG